LTTTFGIGFFGDPNLPIEERVLPAQASVLALSLCELVLAALFIERRQQAQTIADREERLRAIVNTVLDGIITIDDKGVIEDLNPAAARAFGCTPAEVRGHNVNVLVLNPFFGDHDTHLNNYLDTGQTKAIGIRRELTGLRRNGSTFPMELAVSEITVAGRRMFVGAVHDITKRAHNAERQRVLMAELDHRVKNVLARVDMLASSTGKGVTSVDEYIRSLKGRIRSMAAAHNLLSQSGWQNVGLGVLVGKQLAPYASESNVRVAGEDIILGAAEIQAVAMVLHELVTNAAKYGSLSVPDGRVCLTWERVNLDAGAKLVVEWHELGGPPVQSEVPAGYGSSLIRDLIPHELGGMVDLVFAADGVSCKIEIPLEQR
jgi:PAS domain S-box-containing protein